MRYGTALAVAMTATLGATAVPAGAAAPGRGSPVPPPVCDTATASPEVVTLGTADDGRHVCVARGQRVTVVLSVDPAQYPRPASWWGPVTVDGSALAALPDPGPAAPPGTTVSRFQAVRSGTARLESSQSPCAAAPAGVPVAAGPQRCLVIRIWSVTVTVI